MDNEREEGWSKTVSAEGVEEIEVEGGADLTNMTQENDIPLEFEDMWLSDEDEVFEYEARVYENFVDDESFEDIENQGYSETDEYDGHSHGNGEAEQRTEGSVEPNLVAIDNKEDYLQLDFGCVGLDEVKNFHCHAQVRGYAGSSFHSYYTRQEAESAWLHYNNNLFLG